MRGNVKFVDRVRGAVGDEYYIMLVLGNPTPLEDANILANALVDSVVAFLEEPLSPDDLDGFAALTPSLDSASRRRSSKCGNSVRRLAWAGASSCRSAKPQSSFRQ